MKSIGDAVITTDSNGLITFLNPVAEKLTGWSLSEAVGKPLLKVFNIINESTGKKPPNPVKKILEKGLVIELANHTVLISRNGQKIPIDDSGAPIRDEYGNILGAVLVFRDITEQRKAKKDMEYEKSLLDALMNNIPDSIYFKDQQCRLLRINRGMMKSLNMTQDSDYYLKTDIDLFGEEFGRATVESDLQLMETGKPIIGLVEGRKLPDGKINWTSTTKIPLRDQDGKIIGLVGISRGINEIKQAEEQREKIIAELQEALDKIKTLKGLIPICASCKKIRDDQGYWNNVESYIKSHAEVEFTHGICPDCMKKLYPNYCKDDENKNETWDIIRLN